MANNNHGALLVIAAACALVAYNVTPTDPISNAMAFVAILPLGLLAYTAEIRLLKGKPAASRKRVFWVTAAVSATFCGLALVAGCILWPPILSHPAYASSKLFFVVAVVALALGVIFRRSKSILGAMTALAVIGFLAGELLQSLPVADDVAPTPVVGRIIGD
jgi:predicted Kef-type K+ transport protein